MRTINLLPWRQRQQRRCLRFWGLMFTGPLLLALMLSAASRASDPLVSRASTLRHASVLTLRQGLEQRQKELLSALGDGARFGTRRLTGAFPGLKEGLRQRLDAVRRDQED